MNTKLLLLFSAILETQDGLNKVVDQDWKDKGRNWLRAVWTEAGEAMDYLPWPWWKKPTGSLFASDTLRQQFNLELADILCFGMSDMMDKAARTGHSIAYVACALETCEEEAECYYALGQSDVPHLIEGIAASALGVEYVPTFNAGKLFAAAKLSGLGVPGLVAYFYGKNELNHFRQEHGYKEGKYRKNWGTKTEVREDNICLANVIEGYRALYTSDDDLIAHIQSGHFASHVRTNLAMEYNNLPPLD